MTGCRPCKALGVTGIHREMLRFDLQATEVILQPGVYIQFNRYTCVKI